METVSALRPNKPGLVAAWRAVLERKIGALARGQEAARLGTRVDGDHRPANRGERAAVTTQGYLAHGLAQRSVELSEALRLLDLMGVSPREEVAVGAVVCLADESGKEEWFAVFPGGDASLLKLDAHTVCVLSVSSPIIQQLRGLQEGDAVMLSRGGREDEMEVLWVC